MLTNLFPFNKEVSHVIYIFSHNVTFVLSLGKIATLK